jgi:hypothetical protein
MPALSLAQFNKSLATTILNDYFENTTGQLRREYFDILNVIDKNGQPERSIYALKYEQDEYFRSTYIPHWGSVESGLYSKRYSEPKFVNAVVILKDVDISYTVKLDVKYFLNNFSPFAPEGSGSVYEMLDTLTSYTNQCYEYEWITSKGTYNRLSENLGKAKKELDKGKEEKVRKEIESFQNEVEKQNGEKITEEGYKFLYYYSEYIVEQLPAGENLTLDSMTPTITITKSKDLTLTVYGSNFTKKSKVYFKGKKKKTKFISENELEADITDKDFKKEGTYSVHVSEKKIGRTEELEFNVYKKLPEPVIPVLNCIEELEGKTNIAWFGYENYNNGIVFIDGKENEIKGGKKKKGSKGGKKGDNDETLVIFLPGVHEKVFSVEYDDKKNLKWELLKEKAEITEETPVCQ